MARIDEERLSNASVSPLNTKKKYVLNVSLSKNTMGHKLKDCRSNMSKVAYRHVLFVSMVFKNFGVYCQNIRYGDFIGKSDFLTSLKHLEGLGSLGPYYRGNHHLYRTCTFLLLPPQSCFLRRWLPLLFL